MSDPEKKSPPRNPIIGQARADKWDKTLVEIAEYGEDTRREVTILSQRYATLQSLVTKQNTMIGLALIMQIIIIVKLFL